jgi:hypothetical protein
MSTETYEQFKTKYLAHPDAEEAACDNETPERMEARCRRVWTHYHGGLDAAIARADAEEVEIGEMTKTDRPVAELEEAPPTDTMNSTQTTETCDGCACAIDRAKCYYLHFPDGTEEWFCNDCQSSLRQSYIQKADQRGFGFETRWDDEEEEEEEEEEED